MEDSELVAVRTFLSTLEAQLAHSALEAAGIDSLVRADDCAGLRPHMQITGVELLVREEDAEEAERVLSEPPLEENDGSA